MTSKVETRDEIENKGIEWQIDSFDDIRILRYYVDNFDTLSLQQKSFVYYLSEAALCGRDILFDQNFRYNLSVRRILEAILEGYQGDRTSSDFLALERYLKRVWFASGVHHHYSNDKFKPEFSAQFFDTVLESIPKDSLPEPEVLEIVKRVIFDESYYAKKVNQSEGEDMVTTSAVNFYDGVLEAEVEEFYSRLNDANDPTPPSYGLNSTLVKRNGEICEKVWKIGGLYSEAITEVVKWLEKALEVAENQQQEEVIETLISYYHSGSLDTFDLFNILWVGENSAMVDFINGFTESYSDPLGRKATWESVVNFKDLEATKRTEIISDNAQWFEDNSPVDSRFKKEVVKGVSAKVITVAMLGGDCYPASPLGINLPNADWIRSEHGSKSVTIANISKAYDMASQGDGFNEEFIFNSEDRERKVRYGALASNLHTDLHECLGHGSGKLGVGVKGDELKNYGSALEEARADLFALYYIADSKMLELGIFRSKDVAWAEYFNYILNGMMTQLTRIELGKDIEQAHMRNRALVAHWAYDLGREKGVIEKVVSEGKHYIVINDYKELRKIFGIQLREVQRIKSEGDYEAGKELIERYAVKIDRELHSEVLERFKGLGIAPYSGFVNPVYRAVERGGEIVDVSLSYDESYRDQMMRYSRDYSFLK